MATSKGNGGVVKVSSASVAEVRSWTLNQTSDTAEDTVMGDAARTYKATLTSWDGSLDVYWDASDTNGQEACTIGASITISVYPNGADVAETYYTGSAIVTGVSRTGSFDGMNEASITVQGTGALTQTTV